MNMIKSKSSRAGDIVVIVICILLMAVCLLPMINILARSLSSSDALMRNQVGLWPLGFNVESYTKVLNNEEYMMAMGWSGVLTVIFTVFAMVMTIMCAYALTYKNLKGRRFFNLMILFTMYFSAGVMPSYLLYKDMGILNTAWVLILPMSISVFNFIILRSFFQSLPDSLRESAEIDGAGPIRILLRIYIPLSTASLATIALFYAVWRWNAYSDALMYVQNARELRPIQLLLYNYFAALTDPASTEVVETGMSEGLKAASVMFATVPILLIYPWLQRYFIAGATLGAIKE